jgi:hypothetical protein
MTERPAQFRQACTVVPTSAIVPQSSKMLRPAANSVKVLLRHVSSSEGDILSGSKENKPKDAEGPARKRRRIILMDSDDDSGDDATFKPKKEVGGYDFFLMA